MLGLRPKWRLCDEHASIPPCWSPRDNRGAFISRLKSPRKRQLGIGSESFAWKNASVKILHVKELSPFVDGGR